MNLLSERLDYIYRETPGLEGERGQTGLVKASGASKSVVNQWLTGKIKSIDIRYALNVERALGFSHIWLMTGEGDPRDVWVSRNQQAGVGAVSPTPQLHTAQLQQVRNSEMQQLQWVTEPESELLSGFRAGSPAQRERALILTRSFATSADTRTRDQAQ